MPNPPKDAELIASMMAAAGEQRISIREVAIALYRDEGYSVAEARTAVTTRLPSIRRALDAHMNSFQVQRKDEYVMQDGATHLKPIPEIGPLRFTGTVQLFLTGLHWQDFELLVANLMQDDPSDIIAYTRGSQDGGFDFVGKRSVDSGNEGAIPYAGQTIVGDLPLFLMGQAKRYSLRNAVDGDLAATLDGKLNRFAAGTGTTHEQTLGTKIRRHGWNAQAHTLRIVATSGVFTTEALKATIGDTVRLLDGEHLAQRIIFLHEGEDSLESVLETTQTLATIARPGVEALYDER